MKAIAFCITLISFILFADAAFSQNDLILGKGNIYSSAAYYDLSDPMGVNIEVNLWGFVKNPGRYKVPYSTTFLDLISYAGGPNENSDLENIRIYRKIGDSSSHKSEVIKLNYNDLLWSDNANYSTKQNPHLQSGDIIVVQEEKRYTFRDDISFILPILSSILTLITLTVTLTKK